MYEHSSLAVVAVLLGALLIAVESGYRIGFRNGDRESEPSKAQVSAIQGSLLGVLALLLGFTFSLALQRFDTRSQAVVAEANAIGTAVLRADLLHDANSVEAHELLDQYINLRIAAGTISLDRLTERDEALRSTELLQELLWAQAVAASKVDPSPVRSGLFAQAINDAIDAFSERNAALDRHVPELVLFLLFGTFLLTAALVGYSSGIAKHRATFPTYVLMILITFLVFIIIDLDRPRRGLIEVSQQSLIDLAADER